MSEQDEMSETGEPAFAAIGLAVQPVTPPPGLRERILAAVTTSAVVVPIPAAAPPARRRLPVSLVAAAVVLIAVAAFLLGQSLRGGPPASTATFALAGHGVLQGATAKVTDLRSDGVAVVEFSGMPAPPPGKVYEVWLITAAGHADAAAVFVPDPTGRQVVAVNRPLQGYAVMAVTVEDGPAGVSSPTQAPSMSGNVA